MSTHQDKIWLVAYDIRQPRRLRRVHRILRRQGLAAQYSAFTVEADDAAILTLLAALEAQIDRSEDDLRAYHLPARCPVWRLGAQRWPEGVCMEPAHAMRLLLNSPDPTDAARPDHESEPA
jgi:CRISPR-associated protein Cas2